MLNEGTPSPPSRIDRSQGLAETWPFFVIVTVFVAVGFSSALRSIEVLRQPERAALLTVLVVSTLTLHWFSPRLLTERHLWALFVAQAALAFGIGLMTPGHWLGMVLFCCLMGFGAAALWPDWRRGALAVAFCLSSMTALVFVTQGARRLVEMLPNLGLSSLFVVVYVVLFIRQMHARDRAQSLLADLEQAHRSLQEYAQRVEELTLSEERERMGRELHDTLAQGLAGLIMQLEAIDGHLEAGDEARAREIVAQATHRTRSTLREARRAIGALRSSALEKVGLIEAIGREVEKLSASTGIACRYETSVASMEASPGDAQHILRIVQEGLSNIARHAEAKTVLVGISSEASGIRLIIEDDGVGFDSGRQSRGFGLIGLQERAEKIGGELVVEGGVGRGTRIELVMP